MTADPDARRRRLGAALVRAALAVEDALQALLVRGFGLLGRREVTVLPFLGHGTPRHVQVRARVVLGSPATNSAARSAEARGRRASWRTLRESLAPFLTVELPRHPVVVRGPAGETPARCDRQGYLDVAIDASGLAPGWHEVIVETSWHGRTVSIPAPVLVVDPAADLAVISDLDDTVIETGLTRGLEFLRLTLLTSVTERTPLPGAAELYQALLRRGAGVATRPVFYLSTSPWNLYDLLARFIALRGFPSGPLLLTDWGPSRTNLFRLSAEQHKLTLIRALLAEHPGLGVVLIGDTGQLDPEIYAAAAIEAPGRVWAVYVRRTVNISAARAVEVSGLARRVAAAGVPMLMVEDSVQIAEHAAGAGLMDAADVHAVRRALRG
jgi:phosphatidate phosphatase APP1